MRPEPLVPSYIDLRDYPYMPVDIIRLFNSDFHARSLDGEWRAGMTLWLRSFHQVPAGSVPDGDVALARLAEFGRDLNGWKEVKDGALHGWTLCSNDRWYHKVVCEKTLEAWIGKLLQRRSGAIGNAKRWKTAVDVVDIDEQLSAAAAALQKLSPTSPMLKKWRPAQGAESLAGSHPDPEAGDLSSPDNRDPIGPRSQPDSDPIGPRSRKDRNGEGEGEGEREREGVMRASARAGTPTDRAEKPSKPVGRGRKPSPEVPWPEDLAFEERDQAFAAKHGFAGEAGARLFEKFEAKAKAKGWTYKDWHAAFRTFVLNEHPPPARLNGSQPWRPPDV